MPSNAIIEPNKQRAKNAIALIWIVLALNAMAMALNNYQYCLLQIIGRGGEIPATVASISDMAMSVIVYIYIMVVVFSIIAFVKWFERAYSNLHKKTGGLLYTEDWAIISWFIPVICFYRPYRIMKELYCKTKKLLVESKLADYECLSTNLLSWWWVLFLYTFIIENIITLWVMQSDDSVSAKIIEYNLLKPDEIDELKITTLLTNVPYAIYIASALITIKVIKDYSKMEPLLDKANKEEI